MPTSQPKLIARNVAAVRRFADPSNLLSITAGNPVSTRLESGIGNCFPGLECDLRNLERRFFPFLEMDPMDNFIFLASVDTDGVAHAQAARDLSQADASVYAALADDLKAGRSVLVSRIAGTFGVLGPLSLALGLPALGQAPEVDGDLATPSAGAGRKPPDAWTAVRLLTEGTDVTLVFVNDGGSETLTLTAKRARYLDDNGALSAAFLPGELSQSLCSPWTHDFRDCGCFYWASNHPDIAQPALPPATPAGQPWTAPVAWERRDRTIRATPPAKATQAPSEPIELRHYEAAVYADATLVINPVQFGTGLAIKTVEALSYGKPVVATPAGARGLDIDFRGALSLAKTPDAFAEQVLELLENEGKRSAMAHRAIAASYRWQHRQVSTLNAAITGYLGTSVTTSAL